MSKPSAVSRRDFLRTGAAAAAAAALPTVASAEDETAARAASPAVLPRRKLGRTGVEVTLLGQGAAFAINERHLNMMHSLGIRYIDTAKYYLKEASERAIGNWFAKTGHRKDYFLVTKDVPVTPDEMVEEYGCDSLRLYEMYMGPLEVSKPWSTKEVVGVHRFLQRVWRNLVDEKSGELLVTGDEPDEKTRRLLHKTIHRVTHDMEGLRFNTAIAALIELNNALVPRETIPREAADAFLRMLAPLAPHVSEELWEMLARASWPAYEERYLVEDEIEIAVQVMGKLRGQVHVPPDADEETIREKALTEEKVARHLEGKTIRKVIYVKGRLINIVAN